MRLKMFGLSSKSCVIFAVSWLAYASSYFLRKPLGVLKPLMEGKLGFSSSLLGFFDVALLLPYALVQMFFAHKVSIYGSRLTFAACLWLSAIFVFPFGLLSTSFLACFLHIFLEGSAQALLWPCCVRLLDQWTEEKSRTSLMGVFNTCAFVGGIVGTLLSVWIMTYVGWEYVFLINSCFVFVMGVVVYYTCHDKEEIVVRKHSSPSVVVEVPSPSLKMNLNDEKESFIEYLRETPPTTKTTPTITTTTMASSAADTLSWRTLWSKPGFTDVCVCMLCLKVTRYFVYMWLPYLYTKEFGYTEAAAGGASTGFEVGGIFGSLLIGFVIDAKFNGDVLRGVSFAVFVAFLSFLGFTFSSSLTHLFPLWLPQLVFIAVNGAANAGSDAMLGSAVPSQLGKAYGGSTAAITGLINGFGTMGSFIQGPVSGFVGQRWGWTTNLYIMLALNLVAVITAVRASKARSA